MMIPPKNSEESRTHREEIPTRVLIVDDEPLIRWAAAATLAGAGCRVTEASAVAGARVAMASGPVDLAVLDVRLPDGNGVALMKEILLLQPDCRIIMMTAFRTPELTLEAERGAVAVLDKPFGMSELTDLVSRVMAA